MLLEPKDACLIIGKICLTELWGWGVGGGIAFHIQTSICLRVKEEGNFRKINMNLFGHWSPFNDLQDANQRLFTLLPRTHQCALKLAFLISVEVKDSKVNPASNNK